LMAGKKRVGVEGRAPPGGGAMEYLGIHYVTGGRRTAPVSMLTKNRTKNTTNSTFAIQAASAARKPKPNTAAISATIRKVRAQFNMILLLSTSVGLRGNDAVDRLTMLG